MTEASKLAAPPTVQPSLLTLNLSIVKDYCLQGD